MSDRFGLGFDVHPREIGRELYLGGVHFEDEPGLAGHSDADVVCHALADALLGASALGDVGDHFRPGDPGVEGIAGLDLLGRVVGILAEKGIVPRSCDVTVLAERPSIGDHREEIRRNLAAALGVPVDAVSVKATRPEGLGLAGEGAACIALAVASSE
ncbi:MAG: 2-C-methyl-D-erythritol 2,4-cyclodiphosphate synthase [Actinomycetota bacterium]